jgi:hypothetical protein
MADLKEKAIGLLSTTELVDMKTAGDTALFIVPTGKVCRITGIQIRNATASLAGGTSYSVTNWRQAFSLATLIAANTGYLFALGADLAQYTEVAAEATISLTVTVGSTLAATATIDLFGALDDA